VQTILISSLVAACTTLLIEFFAKPSLEKRKTRILEEYAMQRELADWIRRVLFQIQGWESHLDDNSFQNRRDNIFAQIQESMNEYPIINLSRKMGLNQTVDRIILNLLAGLEAWREMFLLGATSDELNEFLEQKIFPLFKLADDALDGSQLRWLPKLKLRNTFRALSS
jgi:hypothetical protein